MDELSKCAICKMTLSDVRAVLSCCDSLVCASHIQEATTGDKRRQFFTCITCEFMHDMENKRFAMNKVIKKFGSGQEQTRQKCSNLADSLSRLQALMADPRKYIHDCVTDMKSDANVHRDELLAELEKKHAETIKRLDIHESECYMKLSTAECEQTLSALKKKSDEIGSNLSEWTKILDNLPIDESQLESIHARAFYENKRILYELGVLKEDLVLNKICVFEKKTKIYDEFELIAFKR